MRRKPQQQAPRHPQIRGGQPADGTGESGIESPRTRSQGEATPEANKPARGDSEEP